MTVTGTAGQSDQLHTRRDTDRPFFGENGFGFDDILDAVNPLQHIPIVSTIYRHFTHDDISMGSRLAGGAIFGGPIGFVASLANAVIEDASGRDVGEHVMAMFMPGAGNDNAPAEPEVQFAATPATEPQAAPAPAHAEAPPPNSFLAALPPREAAVASREEFIASRAGTREQVPARAASGDIPTLSPAALEALMMSVNMGGSDEEQDRTAVAERLQPTEGDMRTPPAGFAEWQAAATAWSAAR